MEIIKGEEFLYKKSNCGCAECEKIRPYPFEFGPVTNFARSYINNKQLTFITNANCNIGCRHCFCPSAFPGLPPGFISYDIIDRSFEIIKNVKMQVSILGGESMLYPEGCKYIADKCREGGHELRLITNGYFGKDEKLVNYVLNEIKPEIITISVDEYHQEFIPIDTIKSLIDAVYGKIEIILETCMDVKSGGFDFDREPRKHEIEESLELQGKKIFYLVDAIKKDGNAIKNDLGYEKSTCKPGYCSACGIVVNPYGKISIKCEFNSRPIHDECKLWNKDIMKEDFDLNKFFEFVKTKKYFIDESIVTEIDLLSYPEKYEKF